MPSRAVLDLATRKRQDPVPALFPLAVSRLLVLSGGPHGQVLLRRAVMVTWRYRRLSGGARCKNLFDSTVSLTGGSFEIISLCISSLLYSVLDTLTHLRRHYFQTALGEPYLIID